MSTTCEHCNPHEMGGRSLAAKIKRKKESAIDYVLSYVHGRPGVDYHEVICDRPAGVSRKLLEATVKHLLYHDKRLTSEHPGGTHAFGRGQARLWTRISDTTQRQQSDAEVSA